MQPGLIAQVPQYPDLARTDRPDLKPLTSDEFDLFGSVFWILLAVLLALGLKRSGLTRQRFTTWLVLGICAWTVLLFVFLFSLLFR